jgi:hypothetical protein
LRCASVVLHLASFSSFASFNSIFANC